MNTPADAPAWYPEAIARLAAIPPNDYPDASYLPLKRAIAGYAGVDANQVVVGAGCDEILALCAQLALGRGDRALVAKPTYQLYTVASRNAGAEVLALDPGDGLSLAREQLVRRSGRTCASCGSAARTTRPASSSPRRDVERICEACPGIVVLDQAYLELGGEDLSGLVAEPREPRRRPHVLEGLRARRGARRLRPRAAGPGRGARRPAAARLDLVLVGRRGRAGLPRDARAAGALRRDRRGARLAGRGHAPRGRRGARARRQLRARALARARRVRATRASAAAPCARSRTSRCWPTASA